MSVCGENIRLTMHFPITFTDFSQIPLKENKSEQSRSVISLKNTNMNPHLLRMWILKVKPRALDPKGVQYSYL